MIDVRRSGRVMGGACLALGAILAGTGALAVAAGPAAASAGAGSSASRAAVAGTGGAADFSVGRTGGTPGVGAAESRPHTTTPAATFLLYVDSTRGTDSITSAPNLCTTAAVPCKTIGQALSAAAADAGSVTISVDPGVYKEATNPGHRPNVIATGYFFAIHDEAGGPATPVLFPESQVIVTASGFTTGIVVNSDHAYVDDLTVRGARHEGIYAYPVTGAHSGVSLTGINILGDVVTGNDTCSTPGVASRTAAHCAPTPTPQVRFGGAVRLQSVVTGMVATSYVAHNGGGILVTDENGPSSTITITSDTSLTNTDAAGIALDGHNAAAVSNGAADASAAGVYDVTVRHDVVSGNDGAGMVDSAGPARAAAYTNAFVDCVVFGNGLPGVAIQSHAAGQDLSGTYVAFNRITRNAVHGGPDGGPGDLEGPPPSADLTQTTGIEILGAASAIGATTVSKNQIATDFYGIWLSAGEVHATTIATDAVSVTPGGTAVFSEPTPDTGYWMAGSDGGVFSFTLGYHGSVPGLGEAAAAPIVGIASTPDGGGYWEAGANGAVYAFGDAGDYGTVPASGRSVADIVGLAVTPDGGGYWLAGADGAVYAFGDATAHGTLPTDGVTVSDVVGIAATATGGGFWMVGADGGVFAFGTAGYLGSVPADNIHISDVVGIAPAPAGAGYWMVGADGGVFAFGVAPFHGSLPGDSVTVDDVVGIEPAPTANGYWMVGRDGGVFAFGSAAFHGSVPGVGVHIGNVVAITSNPL